MPKLKYKLYVDPDKTHTVSIRNSNTGRFLGRRRAKKGERSDQILNIRVKEPEEVSGQVRGFLPEGKKRIPVKGDSRKRGTIRSML